MEEDTTLEKDIASYTDFVYSSQEEEKIKNTTLCGVQGSTRLEEWLVELKHVWLTYSFVDMYGHVFTEKGKELCGDTNNNENGTSTLLFLSQFLAYTYQVVPFLILPTVHWKEMSLIVFYTALYHAPSSSSLVKIQCASYLFQHYHHYSTIRSEESINFLTDTIIEVRDHLLDMMETNHDWDAFDTLLRAMNENERNHINPINLTNRRLSDYSNYSNNNNNYTSLFPRVVCQRIENFRHSSSRPPRPSQLSQPSYAPDYRNVDDWLQEVRLENFRDFEEQKEEEKKNEEDIRIPEVTTVFQDSQNVHDTGIHESVVKNVRILYSEYHHEYTIEDAYQQAFEEFVKHDKWTRAVSNAMRRIQTDPCILCTSPVIYLKDVFRCVWGFIQHHPQMKEELITRLYEELTDAHSTCLSGHFSRLVNVVVGFHPSIQITISTDEQTKIYLQNVVRQLLEQLSMSQPERGERVLEDMTKTNPEKKKNKKTNSFRYFLFSSSFSNEFARWAKSSRKEIIQHVMNEWGMDNKGNKGNKDYKEWSVEYQQGLEKAWDTMFPEFPGILNEPTSCFPFCR